MKSFSRNTAVPICKPALSRRGFFQTGAVLAAASLSGKSFASNLAAAGAERKLAFYNTHTSERLDIAYWSDGAYQPEALQEIYHLLRDYRSGDISPIDARLLDLLYLLAASLDTKERFHIISGYRSGYHCVPSGHVLRAHRQVRLYWCLTLGARLQGPAYFC